MLARICFRLGVVHGLFRDIASARVAAVRGRRTRLAIALWSIASRSFQGLSHPALFDEMTPRRASGLRNRRRRRRRAPAITSTCNMHCS